MKPTYVSWAPYCSRSDNTARELGGVSHMVYWRRLGSTPATVWLKYIGQSLQTWRTLRHDRPDAVFVMAPPIIAVLPVWLYARIARVPFVIDAHTAAFLHPRWRRFQWLQRALSRRAATTIVTNDHLAEQVRAAGAHVTVVRDVPVEFPAGGRFAMDDRFSVAAICSFNDDEPIAEIVRAASLVPDVPFYVTGESRRLDSKLKSQLPPNVRLTGFIPDDAYGNLLTRAGAVLTLTTRDHTMLRGAYEAIYQGTPVIVSDWPLLRQAFDRGSIHVDNSAEAIAAAVRQIQAAPDGFRSKAADLRQRKLAEWHRARVALMEQISKTDRPVASK